MRPLDDAELLFEYATRDSEVAFARLVERYVALVYSSALRQVRNPQLAEEVTQAVFVILARKANTLSRETVLSGWLCRTAHFVSCDALKAERRRQHREQTAAQMDITQDTAWMQLSPLLDEAVAQLGEKDRNAIVLRFYEQKPLNEVGNALRVDADAAQKRVSRALDKLRKFFVKRGVALSAVAIGGVLAANPVQATPVGLAVTVTAAAVKGAVVSGSTLALIKGALKVMAWTKAKTAIVSGAGIFLALGLGTLLVQQNSDQLAASEILARTRDKYASLSNYTSSGTSVSATFVAAAPNEGMGASTNRFSLKLGRPGLYRVEWEDLPPGRGKGAVWSGDDGHFFLLSGITTDPNTSRLVFTTFTNFYRADSRFAGLLAPIAVSGAASTTIPSVFFDESGLDQFHILRLDRRVLMDYVRRKDERINGVDCYVLSATIPAQPTPGFVAATLWIGKRDFLIRQCQEIKEFQQNVPLKGDADIAAELQRINGNRLSPSLLAQLVKKQQQSEAELRRPRRIITTQIHDDIAVNQPLSNGDFVPPLPPGLGPPEPLNL